MRISDWSSDVCSSDLAPSLTAAPFSRNGNATGNFARYCTIWSGTLTNLIEGTDDRRQIHSRRPRPQDHGASAQRRSRVARENRRRPRRGARYGPDARSEEHTSELQSLMRISYAVFCLKKKKHT